MNTQRAWRERSRAARYLLLLEDMRRMVLSLLVLIAVVMVAASIWQIEYGFDASAPRVDRRIRMDDRLDGRIDTNRLD